MHAHGFLPFSQEVDVLQFTILLRVHADIRDAVGENNSGFRQHRLVSLIRGAYSHQVLSDSASPDPPSVKPNLVLGLLFILAVERPFHWVLIRGTAASRDTFEAFTICALSRPAMLRKRRNGRTRPALPARLISTLK